MFSLPVAKADDVSLELRGGGFTVSGKLLSFDGENYVVNSETLGMMMVSVEKFRCVEGACPANPDASPPSAATTIRIAGSTTVGNQLLPVLLTKFAASKKLDMAAIPETAQAEALLRDDAGETVQTFRLNRVSSGYAFEALVNGDADIGAASRPISNAEIGALARAGHPGMDGVGHQHVVGLDGLIVTASPGNPISTLSVEEISRLFSGEITNWNQIGGNDQPVSVYVRKDDSGTFSMFESLVLKPFKRSLAADAARMSSNGDVAEAVAKDAGGIGVVSFSEMGTAKPLNIEDTCGITHKPSRFGVKSGEYPLSRALYFYTPQITEKAVAEFVGFAGSPEGQQAAQEAGFIDRSIYTALFDEFTGRLANALVVPLEDFDLTLMRQLARDLLPGTRLSSTIRFEQSGEVQIDSVSAQQIPPVLKYLLEQDLTKYRVLLAGFSDATGPFAANLEISLRRANAVRDALLQPGLSTLKPEDVTVRAYGELFPVACNDTREGRSKNRRVEVWLVPRRSAPIALNRRP